MSKIEATVDEKIDLLIEQIQSLLYEVQQRYEEIALQKIPFKAQLEMHTSELEETNKKLASR